MKELTEIESQLGPGLNPHQAAEFRVLLSGYYSRMSGQLQDILERKPGIWMEIRKNVASDKSADRAWDATPSGIGEMKLRLQMKRIDKIISSLSSFIRVAENESRNIY